MSHDYHPEWTDLITQTLLKILLERDPYTYGHCKRVARNAKLLAKAAGLSSKDQNTIEYASLFHDLGKISIPDRILLKPDRLTAEEKKIMQTHPVKSIEIIKNLGTISFFQELIPGILHHHERVDGKGYPYGLSEDQVPLHARVILIVDTFDAITTTRPYRKAGIEEFAYQELKKFAGRQFDKQLVQIFLQAHPHWDALEEEITDTFVAKQYKKAA